MKKTVSIILLAVLVLACVLACILFAGLKHCSPAEEPVILPKPQANEDDLIANLIDYLDSLDAAWLQVSTSVAIKINQIKEDSIFKRQPIHVEIDPSSYYFMCAYYNTAHIYETTNFCCAEKYTWVRFENADEIQEYHNGEKMIAAFQINEALFVKGILSGDVNVLGFTHFQPFDTQFNNGINTNEPIVLDKTFIYLYNEHFIPVKQLNKDYIYHSTEDRGNDWVAFSCIRREKKHYILVELYAIHSSGKRSENDLVREFGEYYDTLINMMQTDKEYSITDEIGFTRFYGLIPMYDFINAVLK